MKNRRVGLHYLNEPKGEEMKEDVKMLKSGGIK